MNKLFKTISIITITLIVGIAIGYILNKPTTETQEQFKVSNILYQSTDNFYLDNGDIGVEFSNGSYAIINEQTNTFIFQPSELGDWNMDFNTLQELENCIKTYASIKETGQY